jgi:methionine-rich copper-binding protein CopC
MKTERTYIGPAFVTVRTAALAVLCLWLAAAALPALAHAALVSAVPAAGGTVSDRLRGLTLTFDEPLSAGSRVELYSGVFQAVPGLTSSVDGPVLSAALAGPLAPGNHTVQWTAVTADGHSVAGSYQFGVTASLGSGQGALITLSLTAVIALACLAFIFAMVRRRRPAAVL